MFFVSSYVYILSPKQIGAFQQIIVSKKHFQHFHNHFVHMNFRPCIVHILRNKNCNEFFILTLFVSVFNVKNVYCQTKEQCCKNFDH